MKHTLQLLIAAGSVGVTLACSAAGTFEDRWVFTPCNFWGKDEKPHSLGHFTNVAARAKAAGYNGLVLSAHLDLAHNWPPHLSNQVARAKAFCDGIGMEIIPMLWDVGYGGDCPGNWLESRTVEDLPFVRRGGKAVFDPEPVKVTGGPTERMVFEGVERTSMPMRPARQLHAEKGVRYLHQPVGEVDRAFPRRTSFNSSGSFLASRGSHLL